MKTYKIFYHSSEVGRASGESTWQAIDNFITIHYGQYVRKYLYARPAIKIIKKLKKKKQNDKTSK